VSAVARQSIRRAARASHAFFGVHLGGRRPTSRRLVAFTPPPERQTAGRPFQPSSRINTWSRTHDARRKTHGAGHRCVSALGVENFVVDAGLYVGGANNDLIRSGLGSWTRTRIAFRPVLPRLVDKRTTTGCVWDLGRAERVALSRWTSRALRARLGWHPRRDYGSAVGAQLCLVPDEARQGVLDKAVALIESVGPTI